MMSLASFVSFVSFVSVLGVVASEQPAADCKTTQQCREMTVAAIAAKDFEGAHDLAWRFFQTSRGNADAMSLLARAQSLSGRGDDAFIMLERLIAAGGSIEDVETSDDFRRVREHPRWPQLRDAMAARTSDTGGTRGTDEKGAAGAGVTGMPAASGAPATPKTPATPVPPAAPVPPATPVAPGGLALPSGLLAPGAFAYDAVSARFVVADAASDVLSVVSEDSGNATILVSAGWSGHSTITAVAINRRNGDMWVAAQGDTSSALHRFQLVSGRQLQTISAPDDAGMTQFVAVALTANAVFVLDAEGRRIFAVAAGSKTLRTVAVLPKTITPIGLAHTGASLLLSHADGLLRVDPSSGTSQPVSTAKEVDASQLHSLAWHQGSLLAIQRHSGDAHVVRVRLNARGTNVVGIDRIESASATAGTLSGDDYYFLGSSPAETGLWFQSVPARAPSPNRSPPTR